MMLKLIDEHLLLSSRMFYLTAYSLHEGRTHVRN